MPDIDESGYGRVDHALAQALAADVHCGDSTGEAVVDQERYAVRREGSERQTWNGRDEHVRLRRLPAIEVVAAEHGHARAMLRSHEHDGTTRPFFDDRAIGRDGRRIVPDVFCEVELVEWLGADAVVGDR